MPRLAEPISEAFHAAPVEARERIAAEGLRPGTWASYGEPGVYVFTDAYCAEGYQGEQPMDVWRVDCTGLDLCLDPEDPSIARYTTRPVASDRLTHTGIFFLDGRTHETMPLTDVEYAAAHD